MIRQSPVYNMSRPWPPQAGPQVTPDWADDSLDRLCTKCGAVGTHYLTCPGLRLSPGYRLSTDPEPEGRE
jgi:hypothetical protein